MDWTFDQYNRHWADISKHVADLMQKLNSNLGTVSKKKKSYWNFPLSWLGGSSMPQFSIKKKKTNMVLKHFILPEEHFKANLFFFPL